MGTSLILKQIGHLSSLNISLKTINELRHEKTNVLDKRKQRHRSARGNFVFANVPWRPCAPSVNGRLKLDNQWVIVKVGRIHPCK